MTNPLNALSIDENRVVRLNPRGPHFYNNPFPYYEALRALPAPFYWQDFDLWCYVNAADVDALLRDRRFGRQISHLRSREAMGWPPIPDRLKPFYDIDDRSMIQLEPPSHTRLRGLVQKAFMARQIESLRPRIQALCDRLIDRMLDAREVDLLPAFATPIPVTAIAEMLGVPVEAKDELLAWSHAMVAMYELGRTPEQEDRAVQATLDFSAFVREAVRQKRAHPTGDLLSLLIQAEDKGDVLTEDELIGSCIQLLNAGHEATVNVISNGMLHLLNAPAQWRRLVDNPGLAPTAVEELMRFDTPVHLFCRYALDNLDYAGHFYRFGDQVALILGAANRDPARFERADQLDIGRQDNQHVSFGGGVHFCLGAPLARLELQIALETLARRVPNIRLTEQPEFRNAYHFHGLNSLKVACS